MSERLEEIKNNYLVGSHSLFGTPYISMPKENFDWLIKQAERVEELEETIVNYQKINKQLHEKRSKYKKQMKHYKQTLEEIARDRIPGASYKARQALESDNE